MSIAWGRPPTPRRRTNVPILQQPRLRGVPEDGTKPAPGAFLGFRAGGRERPTHYRPNPFLLPLFRGLVFATDPVSLKVVEFAMAWLSPVLAPSSGGSYRRGVPMTGGQSIAVRQAPDRGCGRGDREVWPVVTPPLGSRLRMRRALERGVPEGRGSEHLGVSGLFGRGPAAGGRRLGHRRGEFAESRRRLLWSGRCTKCLRGK